MLLAALPLVWAAGLRGDVLWHHGRGDQQDSSWDGVAASARSSLETLIHGVEVEIANCAQPGSECDDQTSRQHASQLHRYKTALEELAKIEKTRVITALAKSEAAREDARKTVAKLKTVVLGTELGAHALARQAQLIEEEQAHNRDDQQRATAALAEAKQHLAVTESDAEDKEQAAEVWATEVQAIARAAQLSDQYADAMYASGIEKFSHARAKEQRAEDLLKKAGTLADRIEGHLAPKPIVKEERLREKGGWGGAHAVTTTTPAPKTTDTDDDDDASTEAALADATGRAATEERIARWHAAKPQTAPPKAASTPAVAKVTAPAEPAKTDAKSTDSGDDEMDDIDRELDEIGA